MAPHIFAVVREKTVVRAATRTVIPQNSENEYSRLNEHQFGVSVGWIFRAETR
jgi:hypothetical protein